MPPVLLHLAQVLEPFVYSIIQCTYTGSGSGQGKVRDTPELGSRRKGQRGEDQRQVQRSRNNARRISGISSDQGQVRGQSGTGRGPVRDRSGTIQGQFRDMSGPGQGQVRDKPRTSGTCQGLVRDWSGSGSVRMSGTGQGQVRDNSGTGQGLVRVRFGGQD